MIGVIFMGGRFSGSVAVHHLVALIEQIAGDGHQGQQEVAAAGVVPPAEDAQVLMQAPGLGGEDAGQLFHLLAGNTAYLKRRAVVEPAEPQLGGVPLPGGQRAPAVAKGAGAVLVDDGLGLLRDLLCGLLPRDALKMILLSSTSISRPQLRPQKLHWVFFHVPMDRSPPFSVPLRWINRTWPCEHHSHVLRQSPS